jgi:hypothetical protein
VNYPPPPAGLYRLPLVQRLTLIVAGGVLIGLLATAAGLNPSPRGMGTHQQLGLPPCTVVQWFGIRCPACGMTTSWAHTVRGHVITAARTSAGGTLLAIVSMVCGPWFLISGVCGKWLVAPPREGLTLALGLMIVVITLTDWTLKISLGW